MPEGKFVFLSYAHPDLEIAQKIYYGLSQRKLNVWFDKKCLIAGKWKPQILKAIARSRYFLFCISQSSLKRADKGEGFYSDEFEYAYNIAKDLSESSFTIIPVRLEDCNRGDLRMTLDQQFDLFPDFEGTMDNLAVQMGGISLENSEAHDEMSEDDKLIKALTGKAVAFYFAGNFDGSEQLLNSIFKLKPDIPKACHLCAAKLIKLGQYPDILNSSDKLFKFAQDYIEAMNNRGVALVKLGRYQEALDSYDKAFELNPYYAFAWNNRGVALVKLGRYQEALDSYVKAIEFNPDYADAKYNRNDVLKLMGRQIEVEG